jgi:hypothetical protein
MNFHASTPTPQVATQWIGKDNLSRLDQINKVLRGTSFEEYVSPTRTFADGQIYFTFKKQIPSSARGIFLLDLELMLKDNIDAGIVIWCEPIGDKNSLRNLRGIEIIS